MENPPEYYYQNYHNHYVHYSELDQPIERLQPLLGQGLTYLSKEVCDHLSPVMGWNVRGEFELLITYAQPGVYIAKTLHYDGN